VTKTPGLKGGTLVRPPKSGLLPLNVGFFTARRLDAIQPEPSRGIDVMLEVSNDTCVIQMTDKVS
jgi:hypothetical protein